MPNPSDASDQTSSDSVPTQSDKDQRKGVFIGGGTFYESVIGYQQNTGPVPLVPTSPMAVTQSIEQIEVLLVTVTLQETRAVFDALQDRLGRRPVPRYQGDKTYYDLGILGAGRVWLVRSEMGTATPGGSLYTLYSAIAAVRPAAIIMVGIAFGVDSTKQQIGDVLVAKQLHFYEPTRLDTGADNVQMLVPRGDRVTAAPSVLNHCHDAALSWDGRVQFGLVLSGEKLIDHAPAIAAQLAHEPETVGGEMEGAGLYIAATQHKIDWLLIKAICDWTDGHKSVDKEARQTLAARNAAMFTLHLLGLGGFAPKARQGAFVSGSTYHGPFIGVQINHGTAVNLHALLHDHTGFIKDRLASFVGRADELAEVQQRVAGLLPTGGYLTITGQVGQGKSSLIAKLVELALRKRVGEELPIAQLAERAGPAALAYHFIPFQPGPDHQVGLLRNLMARLIEKYGLSDLYIATDSRPALRDYFARVLIEVAAKGGQEVIFIDGLDRIEEDASGVRDLSFLPTNPPAGIVFVLGTRPNDTLRPLELRKPQQQYWLPPLSRADFTLILQHRGVALEAHLADRFYTAMEANALYLDLVARELAQAGALPAEQIIAQVADNPENLFSLAIERLKRPPLTWREVIKPILGLLLAAREPLPLHVIRVLIGQPDDAVQKGLERLGGLLQRDGEGRYILFHLKLRDYLREDTVQPGKSYVFAADEEERWHQRLAMWVEDDGQPGGDLAEQTE